MESSESDTNISVKEDLGLLQDNGIICVTLRFVISAHLLFSRSI